MARVMAQVWALRHLRTVAACALVCGGTAAWAQSVHKCSAPGGGVTYQSTPCAAADAASTVKIAPGPTAQQVRDAWRSALAERNLATQAAVAEREREAQAAALRQPAPQTGPVPPKADCAKLNQERADLYGRRNQLVRSSKESNLDQSTAVMKVYSDIEYVERRMIAGGCKPD